MNKLHKKNLVTVLKTTNDKIRYLLEAFEIPERLEKDDDDLVTVPADHKAEHMRLKNKNSSADVNEIQDRLDVMTNKLAAKKIQRKAKKVAMNKVDMKKLKKEKEMKKKLRQIHKSSTRNEIIKHEKSVEEDKKSNLKNINIKKVPTFNPEAKIVFSRVEFDHNNKKNKKKGIDTNPRKQLEKIEKEKQEMRDLLSSGQKEEYLEKKNTLAWKKAFDKTKGIKLKDDTELLQKTIKKREHQKIKSKTKWQQRNEKVEDDKSKRQKKRQTNIDKKQAEKKKKIRKTLIKKGRIVE